MAPGGILLRNQRNTNITNTWSTTDAFGFDDSNGDVSGAGGVTTVVEGGNGYELAQGDQSWLWVRRVNVPFTGPGGTVMRPAVEFAFNYKKYNQDKGKSFAPASLSYVDLVATKGLQDNQNYLWNDKYTLSQAGSPNPGKVPGGTGTQNIYQLDTLRLGGFPPAPASLTVVKETAPASSGADQFDFTPTGNGGFKLDTDGDDLDGATKSKTFTFTAFGTKTVTESQLPAGWDLTDIECTGAPAEYGASSATVNLQAGTNATCTFTNTRQPDPGSVVVEKTEGGSSELQREWRFELSGNGITPITKSTADGNPIEFGDLDAGTYTLCEIGIPTGWHSSLEAPPHDGVRTEDGGTAKVCTSVTVEEGEAASLDVDNVRPDIELSKEVRRTPGGSFAKTASAHVGDTVQYRFRVTNEGVGEFVDVDLEELAPDRCDADTMTGPSGDDGDGRLEPGEQWDYFCTHEITVDDPDPPGTLTGPVVTGDDDDLLEDGESVDVHVRARGERAGSEPAAEHGEGDRP
jgi:hypothetical protein